MLSNQSILRGGGLNPGRDARQCHNCVSLRHTCTFNFLSMCNSHMVVVKKFSEFENCHKLPGASYSATQL